MRLYYLLITLLLAAASPAPAQSKIGNPDWCRALPRPQYATLERVHVPDTWFEVYEVAPAVFAIYEPHQFEEVISYLVVGDKRALIFDTGMGIGDIQKLASELTRLPVVVLNSHAHDDHVGDNWLRQLLQRSYVHNLQPEPDATA